MALGQQVRGILGLWFGLAAPVGRKAYAIAGFGLAILKYAIDFAAVYAITGRIWTPRVLAHVKRLAEEPG
jgi:hypothetical protein